MLKQLCLFTFVFSLSFSTYGDDYHYRDVLIGERAAGLGGAFIGISDDPSGLYHNPAGIIFSFEDYFSLSANAYSQTTQTIKDVFPGKDYKYVSSGLIPSFFGFTQNYGRSKWGFAIIVPNSDLIDQDDSLSELSTTAGEPKNFSRKFFRQNTTTYVGPAFTTEVFKNFTMGMSLLGVFKSDKAIDNQFVEYNPDGGNLDRYFIQNVSISQTNLALLPKIGIQYMPVPKWSMGFVVSKMVNLSGEITTKSTRTNVDSNNLPATMTGSFANDFTKSTFNSTTKILSPLEIGTGFAWFPSKKFMLVSDFIYYIKDEDFTSFANTSMYNFSLGGEYYFTDSTVVRTGIYTNNANTPLLTKGIQNQKEHVDMLGLTLSVSFVKPGSAFTIGSNFSSGSGETQAFGNNSSIQKVNQQNFSFYLTGSYQL